MACAIPTSRPTGLSIFCDVSGLLCSGGGVPGIHCELLACSCLVPHTGRDSKDHALHSCADRRTESIAFLAISAQNTPLPARSETRLVDRLVSRGARDRLDHSRQTVVPDRGDAYFGIERGTEADTANDDHGQYGARKHQSQSFRYRKVHHLLGSSLFFQLR